MATPKRYTNYLQFSSYVLSLDEIDLNDIYLSEITLIRTILQLHQEAVDTILNSGFQFPSDGTNPVEIPSVPGSTVTITLTPETPEEPVKTQLTIKACTEEETSEK